MPTTWKLSDLMAAAGIPLSPGVQRDVERVTDDSRQVTKNTLFVAVRGTQADGHLFLPQAVKQGACAVLVEEGIDLPHTVARIIVPSTQAALGPLVSAFYGDPSWKMPVIGITGTNGKTTVAWLAHHLLEASGLKAGLIGTICYKTGKSEKPSSNTTPGVVALQTMFSEMLETGLKACVMEVSSHALDQRRTDGTRWACGVFTNFGSEHLDYHKTREAYLRAKLRLFESLPRGSTLIVNRDDPAWERVVMAAGDCQVLGISLAGKPELTAEEIRCSLDGTECLIRTPEGAFPLRWNVVGRHNIQNLLSALGAISSVGVPFEKGIQAAASFPGVPGRLERVDNNGSFPVFVDYAHTDDALKCVLEQLRAVTDRKILLVFGCGGDRDKTKRPRMGRVAAQLADRVILTSDNPRSEDPEAIARDIEQGLDGGPAHIEKVLDRREAIRRAIQSAGPDWVVLIAGKGHETGQIIGGAVIPFDDREVARIFLKPAPAAVGA